MKFLYQVLNPRFQHPEIVRVKPASNKENKLMQIWMVIHVLSELTQDCQAVNLFVGKVNILGLRCC